MDFSHLLQDKNRIGDEDVTRFRREVFEDMLVSRAEAEGVIALNASVAETCQNWNDFFVEAMVDYCVNQARPQGYVSDVNAEWLIGQITNDGHIDSDSELELLVKTIERAKHVPDFLAAFALKQVAEAVLEGNGALLRDDKLVAGVIGAPEARLIRRVMYGVGAEGRIGISKAEVEVLFDLNDKSIEAENHPEWADVFVKAVAFHLMAASGYQMVGRKEAMRREEWLDDDEVDVQGVLSQTLSSIGKLFGGGVLGQDLQGAQSQMSEAWRERNEQFEKNESLANPVDERESEWLVERIGRDGVLHENEKALLEYLKKASTELHPSLVPLLDKVA